MQTTRPVLRAGGFTLVEMMIVLLIISIMAAAAYPSYGQYIARSNRRAVEAALYRVADRQEQFFLDNKEYADSLSTLGYEADKLGLTRDGQFTGADADDITYVLTLEEADATSYQLQASPEGVQAERDADCGALTLDNNGNRGVTGDAEDCW